MNLRLTYFFVLFLLNAAASRAQPMAFDTTFVYKRYSSKRDTLLPADPLNLPDDAVAVRFFLLKMDSVEWFYKPEFWRSDSIAVGTAVGRPSFLYENVPSGHQTIFIIGKRTNGGPEIRFPIHFTLSEPIWKSWWFPVMLLMYLLAIAGLIGYLFYSHQKRQKRRMDALRQRLAFDLHDELGSTLGSIALLGEWAAAKLRQRAEPDLAALVNPKLENAVSQTRGVLHEIQTSIWAINPSHTKGGHLIEKFRQLADELIFPVGTHFLLETDEKIGGLTFFPEENRQLVAFVRECFHNISKYAKASEAVLKMGYVQNWVQLEIRDDGQGFDLTEKATTGNGLLSLETRAKKLNGSVKIEASRGGGVRIRLRFQREKNPYNQGLRVENGG